MNALQHSAQDASRAAGGQARQGAHRPAKLIVRLGVVFLVFAVAGVALNCAVGYFNTRQTYFDAQSERLHEVGDYVASSAAAGVDLEASDDSWSSVSERLDDYASYDEASAACDEAYDAYYEIYDQLQEKYGGKDAAYTDEETKALTTAYDEYKERYDVLVYYSLCAMLERTRSIFRVDGVAILDADPDAKTVRYIAAVGTDVQDGGSTSVYGRTESRAEGYDDLWVFASNDALGYMSSYSYVDTCFLAYVALPAGDERWVVEVSLDTEEFESAVLRQMMRTVVLSCLVIALCLAGILFFLRQLIVRPITSLSRHVRAFSIDKDPKAGQAVRAEKLPSDEVGMLAKDVADMMDEIHRHVEEVARVSAENERVRSELAVASRIQLGALPAVTPVFSGGDGRFSLFASMSPAKEVGGDFYDFFMVDADRLAVVVADVSGKGVPAALFMMRAKALIRQLLAEGLSPEVAMSRANDSLATDNDENMFVTVWLGVLDARTGELAFSNGGHNPPVMMRASGDVEWLRARSGLLMGGFAGVPYRARSVSMAVGDTLVLYTDGVTEAMNERSELYGEERLEALLRSIGPDLGPRQVEGAVRADIAAFAGQAEQADDITLLVVRRTG